MQEEILYPVSNGDPAIPDRDPPWHEEIRANRANALEKDNCSIIVRSSVEQLVVQPSPEFASRCCLNVETMSPRQPNS